MRRIIPLATAALLLWSPAALAADITPEALKSDIEGFLADNAGDTAQGYRLAHGEVAVVPEGNGLRVTVPALRLEGLADIGGLDFGSVSFLVTPRDDGRYGFSDVSIPESVSQTDDSGAVIGSLVFDLQSLSGVWAPDIGELTDLDLLLRGLELRSAKAGVMFGLARAAGTLATMEGAEGRWTQTQDYRLDGLVLAEPDSVVDVKSVTFTSSFADFNPETYRTLVALFEDLGTAAASGDQARVANLRDSLANLGDLSGSFHQRLEIADTSVTDAEGKGTLTLRRAGFSLEAETPRDSTVGSAALLLDGEGLAMDPAANPDLAPYAGLIPDSWSLPVSIDKIPNEATMRVLADLAYEMAKQPGGELDIPLTAAGRSVLDALGAAGSRVLVRGLFVQSELTRLEGKASLLFSPSSPLGLVGNTDLTLVGLDRVLALAEGLSDPDAKRGVSGAALGLMGVGQATALADGKVGYRYSFVLAPDGGVTMNGLSFGDLLNRAIPQ